MPKIIFLSWVWMFTDMFLLSKSSYIFCVQIFSCLWETWSSCLCQLGTIDYFMGSLPDCNNAYVLCIFTCVAKGESRSRSAVTNCQIRKHAPYQSFKNIHFRTKYWKLYVFIMFNINCIIPFSSMEDCLKSLHNHILFPHLKKNFLDANNARWGTPSTSNNFISALFSLLFMGASLTYLPFLASIL